MPGKIIEPADRTLLYRALDTHARREGLAGLRLNALVNLAHSSALDLAELLALDFASIFAPGTRNKRWAITAPRYLRPLGRGRRRAPPFLLPDAVPPLRAYVEAAIADHRLRWPAPHIPLFHDIDECKKPRRLSPRTVQAQFATVQRAAGLAAHYRLSDLRHDAITRYAQRAPTVGAVANYARISERSALAYTPTQQPAGFDAIARALRAASP